VVGEVGERELGPAEKRQRLMWAQCPAGGEQTQESGPDRMLQGAGEPMVGRVSGFAHLFLFGGPLASGHFGAKACSLSPALLGPTSAAA
jgi:hypothetical protein